jgi:hypothetical protein
MAFDLTQTQFGSVRALNAGADPLGADPFLADIDLDLEDHSDPLDVELTPEQLSEFRPLYNTAERTILRDAPTDQQRAEILHTALHRGKQESKQKS